MKRMIQKGFTLIELMIVVAIIGILAAVALPAYQDYTIRAQVSESMALASGLKTAVSDYFSASGAFPADNVAALCGDSGTAATCAGSLPTDNKGNYVSQIAVLAGALNVTMGNKANAAIQNQVLSIRPALDTASNVSWLCGYSPIPDASVTAYGVQASTINRKYVPNSCK
jgi:type IV pilus assembly protein PilA